MNEIVYIMLITEDKFVWNALRQPGFTYISLIPFTKNKEGI